MLQFADSLVLDAPKRTAEGYLITRARAARTGVYQYSGREIDPRNEHGLRDKAVVNVLRDESTVFDKAAAQSFIGKPVTDDHPSVAVTADNWKEHARGTIMGALRDGEYLAFDLLITDAAAIRKVEAGKRELSNGYAAEIEYGQFQSKDGIMCDARQAKITGGNHCALVDAGRAGSECAIKDSNGGKPFAACDANPLAISGLSTGEKKMKIMLDGLHVDLTDAEAVKAAFDKVKGDADKAIAANAKELADAKESVATLTTEKVALEKQVADAKNVDLDKLVADRAELVAKAKSLKSDIVTDGKTADDIRKEIVSANLGDAAKDFDAAQIAAAFAVISKDAKTSTETVVHIDAAAKATAADGAANVAAIRNLRYA